MRVGKEQFVSSRRGDTLIEVIFATTIFSMLAIMSLSAMNSSMQSIKSDLERASVRDEISAQAEAIRFIHNSYSAEREYELSFQEYRDLWKGLVEDSLLQTTYNTSTLDTGSCSDLPSNAFIINTRSINPGAVSSTIVKLNSGNYQIPSTYANILYGAGSSALYEPTLSSSFLRSEGIWINVFESAAKEGSFPQYYDFHISSCWNSISSSQVNTISTIVRLYNPELIEVSN